MWTRLMLWLHPIPPSRLKKHATIHDRLTWLEDAYHRLLRMSVGINLKLYLILIAIGVLIVLRALQVR